jgi:hypothetical protein
MEQMDRLNIELFKKVRERIAAIPESYDQNRWYKRTSVSPCGTAACLAGETIICAAPTIDEGIRQLRELHDEDEADFDIPNTAGELLGLDGDYMQWGTEHDIFMGEAKGWPEPYRTQFTERGPHIAVLGLLDEIITTGKVRLAGNPQPASAERG